MSKRLREPNDDDHAPREVKRMASVHKALACPVCYNIMYRGPIYQCKQGHVVCTCCYSKLSAAKCPSCAVAFDVKEPSRARHLETLRDEFELPCPFAEQGCTATFVGADFDKHSDECKAWQYECNVGGCSVTDLNDATFVHHMFACFKSKSTHYKVREIGEIKLGQDATVDMGTIQLTLLPHVLGWSFRADGLEFWAEWTTSPHSEERAFAFGGCAAPNALRSYRVRLTVGDPALWQLSLTSLVETIRRQFSAAQDGTQIFLFISKKDVAKMRKLYQDRPIPVSLALWKVE